MLGTASHLERSTLAPRRELSVTHRCRGTATLRCAAVSENTHKKVQSASQTHGLAVAVPRMLAAAAASIILTGQPAWSDIQTVAPSDVTSAARALPAQKVNKEKVWLIFLGSATALFGAAVAVERSGSLFPAIARANKAMEASREAMKRKEEELAQAEAQAPMDVDITPETKVESSQQADDAVLQGLNDARGRTPLQPSSSASGTEEQEGNRETQAAVETSEDGEPQAAASPQSESGEVKSDERKQERSAVGSSGS